MGNRKVLSLLLVVLSAVAGQAFAKRTAPPQIEPVVVAAIKYLAPNAPGATMGFIEAHDAKSGLLIWSRQIYVVIKDPELEGDVQDVFITEMTNTDNGLHIKNERGCEYQLDLKTLEVKATVGTVLVDEKARFNRRNAGGQTADHVKD